MKITHCETKYNHNNKFLKDEFSLNLTQIFHDFLTKHSKISTLKTITVHAKRRTIIHWK